MLTSHITSLIISLCLVFSNPPTLYTAIIFTFNDGRSHAKRLIVDLLLPLGHTTKFCPLAPLETPIVKPPCTGITSAEIGRVAGKV